MIVSIVGPTGIGKSKLGVLLAKHYNTEIISGDSIQVYKELNIGSAKISKDEMMGIKHHLLDFVNPHDNYSVALYQKEVRKKIDEFYQRGLLPIIVGGTGLYIKSVLYNYNFEQTKRDIQFQESFKNYSNQELHCLLKETDPLTAEKLHPNNRKRVLQALQRSKTNKVSENNKGNQKVYDFIMIGLKIERQKLWEIINKRVDQMVDEGLLEEVKSLYDKKINSNAIQAIGYKELYEYFDGKVTIKEAIDNIKLHTRQLAKKQDTFFRNQFPVNWIEVDFNRFDLVFEKAVEIIDREQNKRLDLS